MRSSQLSTLPRRRQAVVGAALVLAMLATLFAALPATANVTHDPDAPTPALTSVITGIEHTCGLAADGTAWCWGDGSFGKLGNNANADQTSPVAVDMTSIPGGALTTITTGGLHTCGLAADGTAWCWGSGDSGRLGNNATTDQNAPVPVDMTSIPGNTLTTITAGGSHTCGLAADGTAWCWGYGANGRLGNNATTAQTAPVPVDLTAIPGNTLTTITAGGFHTCGLAADGTAWCWGYGAFGQLGNNDDGSEVAPVPVDMTAIPGNILTTVTAGTEHTCGLAADGTAWCWGNGNLGQLGNITTISQSPVAVDMTPIPGNTLTTITAGGFHTCGLAADGTAWCWGYGANGRLGNNATTNHNAPVPVDTTSTPGGTLTTITAGYAQTCGLAADGTAWCWGAGGSGRLGNNATTNQTAPVPVDMTDIPGNTLTTITAGTFHTCGLAADGTAWCWGAGAFGRLGNNATTNQTAPVPVDMTDIPGNTLTTITAGSLHTCGLAADGTAWCWGYGNNGRLGNNATTNQNAPVPVDMTPIPGNTLTTIGTGGSHTCGLAADGTAWCWGDGSFGKLGNNANADQTSPVAVDMTSIPGGALTTITTGGLHTCGLAADGTAWCWGTGNSGQLGNNATTSQIAPVPVDMTATLGNTLTTITAGHAHTCGLAADGTAWCWGDGSFGKLGNNATTNHSAPVPVDMTPTPGNTLTTITAGTNHTCGLAADGTAWCWGNGANGRLGNNDTSDQTRPVPVDVGVTVMVQDVGGDVGEQVTFTAVGDGLGPVSYQWFRDGVEIGGATDPTYERTLIAGDHEVDFSVTITNPFSQTASDTATVTSEPTADAGGPYQVDEGDTVQLDASGSSDDDGDTLTFVWDLDDDGQYDDAVGVSPTFDATGLSGPDTIDIAVQVSDGTTTDVDTTTVTVEDVPVTELPTVTFTGDAADLVVTTVPDTSVTIEVEVTPAEAEVGWDLDGDGDFDDATGTAATLTPNAIGVMPVAARATTDGGSAVDILSLVVADPDAVTVRAAGASRIDTALQTSKGTFADGAADAVVLARADVFADALAGTALAVRGNAPLLLTPASAVPDAVLAEIDRVLGDGGGTIYLLGGLGALPQTIADQLAPRPTTRLAGESRYDTAIAIADEIIALTGAPDTVLIARGDDFPDGLAAGAVAGTANGVVVLTAGSSPATATNTFLAEHPAADLIAVGGAAATAHPDAEPIVGTNRYATAVAVADRFLTTPTVVGIARGNDFPDAMTGGVHIARLGGPLLLTLPATLPGGTATWLCTNHTILTAAHAYGGTGAIHDTTLTHIHNTTNGTTC